MGKAARMSSRGWMQRHLEWDTEGMLCYVIFLPSLSLHPSPQRVWIGWDITTTTEKIIICEYLSQLSVGVLQCFLHLFTGWCPSSTTPQLPLYLSTSHCPLATLHYLQPPHSSLKSLSRTPALPP